MAVLSVVLSLLFIVIAVALILVILVQRPQGGGLAGAFGGAGGASSQSAFGAKTGDMLTFATVTIFVLFLLTSMGMVWMNQAQFSGRTPAAPDAPGDLAITITSPTGVLLNWTDNSKDETQFFIERSANGLTEWEEVGTTDSDATSFSDSGLTPGSTYFYRVSARNPIGPSTATDAVNITLPTEEEAKPDEGGGDAAGAEGTNQPTEEKPSDTPPAGDGG